MTSLTCRIVDAAAARQSASPAIVFRLRIGDASGERVHAVALRAQIQIRARARSYVSHEQERLTELFGTPAQWERTLTNVLWTQSSVVVPSFVGEIEIDLPVSCTYDLEVASAKYLHAVRDGDVPVVFAFSGTIFKSAPDRMHVELVAHDLESRYLMPARVWHDAMDQFFPGGGWVRLRRETLDRLQAFRGRQALVGWDDAIDRLLERVQEQAT